jgi:glycine C-acetyltransferase
MAGRGEVIVLSSNNYLGLAEHPEVVRAGIEGLERYGAGTASVRFICGTFAPHLELERTLAELSGTEAALTYVSCWNANEALIPTLTDETTVILTDALNHASIIDAVRLSRPAQKVIYPHSDMNALRDGLAAAPREARKLVITDGVFSMEGDLARLPEIVELAREFDAVVIVDDSHGVGVLGETGRGVVEHYGLLGEVDVLTGTLGKALGGAAGGYVASSEEICDLLAQRSRPQLFSNALPPTVACSARRAVELMLEQPELLERLRANTASFREQLVDAGYRPLEGEAAIIPIIVGETASAIALSERLLDEGVFVTGFGFPVVPEGTARIRVQMSAALEPEHLERAIEAFRRVQDDVPV